MVVGGGGKRRRRDKGNHPGRDTKDRAERERRVCVCATGDAASCKTKTKPNTQVKRILRRNACAYRGRCTGVSGCAPAAPDPPVAGVCAGAPNFTPCGNGLGCVGGQCVDTCRAVVDSGPPAQARFSIEDDGSGVVSIVVTRSQNADTVVPPFIPGTTDPITVTSTKIDQTQPARIEMRITNGAGDIRICDVTF